MRQEKMLLSVGSCDIPKPRNDPFRISTLPPPLGSTCAAQTWRSPQMQRGLDVSCVNFNRFDELTRMSIKLALLQFPVRSRDYQTACLVGMCGHNLIGTSAFQEACRPRPKLEAQCRLTRHQSGLGCALDPNCLQGCKHLSAMRRRAFSCSAKPSSSCVHMEKQNAGLRVLRHPQDRALAHQYVKRCNWRSPKSLRAHCVERWMNFKLCVLPDHPMPG